MTRVAVVLFGAATLLSHPPRDAPPQRPATGTIRGRVVAEASGDPIRNARVSVTDVSSSCFAAECAEECLIAGGASLRELQRQLLQPVCGLETVPQSLWRVALAGAQDLGIVLRVGRESQVDDREVA